MILLPVCLSLSVPILRSAYLTTFVQTQLVFQGVRPLLGRLISDIGLLILLVDTCHARLSVLFREGMSLIGNLWYIFVSYGK
ncbi:hypothetical protein F5Y14DRAFT_410132 [Nemania sp. NC0429]|nr:hypothetical protein F5Y14DRAFT_410132 [Nemania sp. NC0429]